RQQTEDGQELSLLPLPIERLVKALAERLHAAQLKIGDQPLHHAAHGGSHLRGIASSADVQRACWRIVLQQWQIDERRARLYQGVIFGVARHADDFAIEIFAEEFETFAQRRFTRPEPPGHRLVDDDDLGRTLAVLLAEIAALQDGDAERLKEMQADVV